MVTGFVFDEFQVRPAERRVLWRGQPVALGARAFDVLLALIAHRERVVAKHELMELVWPGVVVEEGNVAAQISSLRKVLGGDTIATIPGRGYRFTAPVAALGPQGSHSIGHTPPTPPQAAPEQLARKPYGPPNRDHDALAPKGSWVPAALTPILGRESALEQTLQALRTTRCLTLIGAGGSGKTRLALALAATLQPRYDGGVWWVELVDLSDPKSLATTLAQAMGVADPLKPALQTVVERLAGHPALLVLDNCEHVVEECARFIVELLQKLPALQVLATSRESLRIAGETAWTVPPLEVPGVAAEANLDDLAQLSSVQLLLERVRQHDREFTLTPGNAASLVQICRRLEGLPLALELVAARVGPLSVDQIAARLDHSLRLLNVGQRGGMRHHQTMAAAVEWGYKLLGDTDRALFVRLAVFVGGWAPDGAQALCEGLDIEAEEVPDVLARLTRVSMVLAFETEGAVRFRMLEPIRQFALAKLEASRQSEPARARLLAWYLVRCKALAAKLTGPQQATANQALGSEVENLRALLSWSKQGDRERGLQLAAALWRFWQVKGYAKEMLSWFEEVLPLAQDAATVTRADAYNSAGVMARTCGLYADAVRLHDTSLALQRELGNRRGEAVALNNLAVVARDQYDHAMVERYGRESLTIAREIGDRNLEGLGLMHLGTALRGQNKLEEAEASFKASFVIFSELGEKRSLAALLNFLGSVAQAAGRWSEAERCFEDSLEINQTLDDFWGIAISTRNMASLQCTFGHHSAAVKMLMRSLANYRRAGVKHGLEECFELLAQIAVKRGRLERAAWCWGVLEQLEQDIGKVVPKTLQAERERTLRELEVQVPGQRLAADRAAGRQVALEEAFRVLLADGGWA